MYDQYERSYKIEKCKEKFAWEVEKIVEEKLVDSELDIANHLFLINLDLGFFSHSYVW